MHKTLPLMLLALSACQVAPGNAPSLAPAQTQISASSPEVQAKALSQPQSQSQAQPQKGTAPVAPSAAPALTAQPVPVKAASLPLTQAPKASSQPAKQISQTATGLQSIPITSLNIPQGFDYATTQDVQVDIQVKSPNGAPYQKVMVAIYATDAGLNPLVRGVTDASGRYQDLMRIPGYHRSLQVQVSALGIENFRQVPIRNRQITAQFGQ